MQALGSIFFIKGGDAGYFQGVGNFFMVNSYYSGIKKRSINRRKTMKKLSFLVMAMAVVMFFAIPAMAVDVEFSGKYRARGYYMDNSDLNNDEGASRDFMDMRLRVKTEFNISDSLSLTTQFDALDNKHWGDSDLPDDVSDDNIDFDQAYLAAKFNLFDLYVGRMDSDNYGLAFNNSRADVDRIVVSKTLDPITLQLVYEKRSENDASTDDPQTADEDYDVYRLNLEVRQDNFQGCLLTSYYNNKTMSDVSNTDNIPAAGTNPNYAEKFWLFTPYFKANLGPVYLEGEAGWMTGKYRDYTDPDFADDQDLDAMSYYLAANFNAGPAKVGLGYAFV
jgi:hypothetical protein